MPHAWPAGSRIRCRSKLPRSSTTLPGRRGDPLRNPDHRPQRRPVPQERHLGAQSDLARRPAPPGLLRGPVSTPHRESFLKPPMNARTKESGEREGDSERIQSTRDDRLPMAAERGLIGFRGQQRRRAPAPIATRFVDRDGVAARPLGVIEPPGRPARAAPGGSPGSGRRARDAHAGDDRDRERRSWGGDRRPGEAGMEPRREQDGRVRRAARSDDDEFIAPITRHQVAPRTERRQDLRRPSQDLVAGGVPVRVVDPLEMVEVHDQDRERGAVTPQVGPLATELVLQPRARLSRPVNRSRYARRSSAART